MNNCTHSQQRQKYVTTDHWGDEIDGYWEYWEERTTEDIDLHRFRCTQCKEIMYYSGAARKYYEEGINNDVLWNK